MVLLLCQQQHVKNQILIALMFFNLIILPFLHSSSLSLVFKRKTLLHADIMQRRYLSWTDGLQVFNAIVASEIFPVSTHSPIKRKDTKYKLLNLSLVMKLQESQYCGFILPFLLLYFIYVDSLIRFTF